MLTFKDISWRSNSLHRAMRITPYYVICINVHVELTATGLFYNTVSSITTGRLGSLIQCWELAINLKLVPYARGKNRKPLPWRRHGICFIFHVHNLGCIIDQLDLWKRWVADGESFFILRFTYEHNLIYISPLFSFTDAKKS